MSLLIWHIKAFRFLNIIKRATYKHDKLLKLSWIFNCIIPHLILLNPVSDSNSLQFVWIYCHHFSCPMAFHTAKKLHTDRLQQKWTCLLVHILVIRTIKTGARQIHKALWSYRQPLDLFKVGGGGVIQPVILNNHIFISSCPPILPECLPSSSKHIFF